MKIGHQLVVTWRIKHHIFCSSQLSLCSLSSKKPRRTWREHLPYKQQWTVF